MVKFTFVTSSTFSCLIADVIWVRFSAGGAAVAEVAALPVVLLSEVEGLVSAVESGAFVLLSAFISPLVLVSEAGLVSAVGVFKSFELVLESVAFVLLSAFISPVVLLSGADLVSAVGFFMSLEVVVGAVESDAVDLLSAFISPVAFESGLPCAC